MNRAQSSPFPMMISLFITMIIGVMVVQDVNEELASMPSDVACCAGPDMHFMFVPLLILIALMFVPAMGRFMLDFLEEQ